MFLALLSPYGRTQYCSQHCFMSLLPSFQPSMATSWHIDFSNEYVLTNGGRILLSSGDMNDCRFLMVKEDFCWEKVSTDHKINHVSKCLMRRQIFGKGSPWLCIKSFFSFLTMYIILLLLLIIVISLNRNKLYQSKIYTCIKYIHKINVYH